jgi:phosphoserine phosphatase RsbU/P
MALELDAGGAEVSVACAGHPAPVFVPRDGDPSAVNSVGTLLGLVAEVDLPTASVRLAPGASVVAYTDRVTDQGPEVRDPVEQAIAARPAGAPAEQLADMLLGFARGPAQRRRDDIAILALRFIGDGA